MKKKSLNIKKKLFDMKRKILNIWQKKFLNIWQKKFLNINFRFGLDKKNSRLD